MRGALVQRARHEISYELCVISFYSYADSLT